MDETIHEHTALQEPLQFLAIKFQPIPEASFLHPYELAKVTSNFFYENKQNKKEKEKVQKQKFHYHQNHNNCQTFHFNFPCSIGFHEVS